MFSSALRVSAMVVGFLGLCLREPGWILKIYGGCDRLLIWKARSGTGWR